jgi:hypothetical protein
MTTARDIGLSHRIFTGRDNKAGSKGEQNLRVDRMSVSVANNFDVERTSNTTVDTDDGSVHLATI